MEKVLEELDKIGLLFDKNQPYFYKGRDGHINFCWPRPWENKAAHEYLDKKAEQDLQFAESARKIPGNNSSRAHADSVLRKGYLQLIKEKDILGIL